MKALFTLLTTAILLAALSGCSGVTFQSPVNLNLAGTWQFTFHSSTAGMTATGTVPLQQNGTTLSGQMTLSGAPCATTAVLTGAISGTRINFQLQEGTQPVNFTGSIAASGNSASGTYASPSGGCTNGDTGTWSASKI